MALPVEDNISVIIPTYNERENIGDIISAVSAEVRNLKEIIIVDDDSPDNTWEAVNELAKNDNRIRLIHRLGRRGLPQAIEEGIRLAGGDFVFWLDADFASLPLTLKRLSDSIDGCDIVVASRYIEGAADRRNNRVEVIASRLFNKFAALILSTSTKDLTSGFILARRGIFDKIRIRGLYGEYCVGFLYQAQKLGLKIKEVPYIYFSRPKGKSKTSGNILLFMVYGLVYILTVFKLRLSE